MLILFETLSLKLSFPTELGYTASTDITIKCKYFFFWLQCHLCKVSGRTEFLIYVLNALHIHTSAVNYSGRLDLHSSGRLELHDVPKLHRPIIMTAVSNRCNKPHSGVNERAGCRCVWRPVQKSNEATRVKTTLKIFNNLYAWAKPNGTGDRGYTLCALRVCLWN